MRSKLCFIIPEYNATTPTHFNYIYGLIDALRKDLDIFLIIEKGGKPDFIKNGSYYAQRFSFLPLRALENILAVLYARLKGYRNFYIHYSFLSAFNASIVAKISGGRTFYWNCGLPWLYKRGFFREAFERLVYKNVDFLVTGTEGLKKEYSKHYSLPLSKIKVLPNWIDLENFRIDRAVSEKIRKEIDPTGKNKILLFVHRLSKRKGVHYLPDIISSLKNENVILAVIGDGPEREVLESKVKKSLPTGRQEKSKVKFFGWIPNEKIKDYFGAADIFIMPSEEEGFPHVLLEAMASGVPFIAFSAGGVREISPPEFSGHIVTLGDKNGFINKVKELLHYKEEEIGRLSDIEKKWVKRFDLPVVIEKFKNLLYYDSKQ